MENVTTNTPAENQQVTTQPEENGTPRLFTQNEVNQIVSERLKREQNKKADNSEYETRLQELTKREKEFECQKWLDEQKLSPAITEYIDTSDVEKFKKTVGTLRLLFNRSGAPKIAGSDNSDINELIKKTFQSKKITESRS